MLAIKLLFNDQLLTALWLIGRASVIVLQQLVLVSLLVEKRGGDNVEDQRGRTFSAIGRDEAEDCRIRNTGNVLFSKLVIPQAVLTNCKF